MLNFRNNLRWQCHGSSCELDETCYFVAVDFDKANWHDDARAFLDVCRRLQLPAVLERRDSDAAGTCGASSKTPVQPRWLGDLGRTF